MADTDALTATPPRTARKAEADPLPAAPAAPPASHVAPSSAPAVRSVGPPLAELEFVGCDPVPMTREQVDRYEGRYEFWDAEASTAWMVRELTGAEHEYPSHKLSGLAGLIAMVRGGTRIACYGSAGLEVRDARGELRRVIQADQTVYLRPLRVSLPRTGGVVVGEHAHPDVVLEVDSATDVRRGKLLLYEAWGFPELWVDVPDLEPQSRPRGLTPGLTIHRLESGRYRESEESGAFPGWRAEDIHAALNEMGHSERTAEELIRLGRWLGSQEGTNPEDDLLLRSLLNESWEEGFAESFGKGRVVMVRQMLLLRGIEVSGRFLAGMPGFAESTEAELVAAAAACESGEDFRARLARLRDC